MTEIASGLLRLRPLVPCTVPLWTGQALQAIFLSLLRDHSPALSDRLHQGSGPRPYTVSSLLGLWARPTTLLPRREQARPTLVPDQTFGVRITTLDTEVTHTWFDKIVPGLNGHQLHIGDAVFVIEREGGEPIHQERSSDTALVQEYMLLGDRLEHHMQFRFESPTAFRSKEMLVPLPNPALLFGSLLDRWNAFNDIKLHPDTRRFAEECIAVSRFRLETVFVDPEGQDRRPVTGCVGSCRYVVLRDDRYWLGIVHALAAYATFAGVGLNTATGMGRLYKIHSREKSL